ncbi:hypothetical protein SDRG_12739 [Saprolegnia diclina VS20]|uniref:Peptidase C1A papain C-terminal domain-containing protein n=1 Tax=Saprolegnia diclina (strain VS20) TaxID=1156394 RepID=T0Q4I9_SAPDV|nr:hypothetical protein SDRG_12739 [Saprolegnia diclina VS20]EQC29491.1 hypothetical protein SDRG_12739 [Saprolegnia diclina VS20]|eukprot:XP_008617043.1 hypothetical protein SDRG_12739 [Saprolegnia diclina VS20]
MRFWLWFFALLLVSRVAAALNISADERHELSRDLALWQKKFGDDDHVRAAMKMVRGTLTTDDLLGRLKATKDKLPALRAANPHATFSHLTKFALLTRGELARFTSGPRMQAPSGLPYDGSGSVATDTIDWVPSMCVYPVQDQGSCFSLWAMAAIQVAASAHCLATSPKRLLDISIQEVVSCANPGGPDGCHGGDAYAALKWILMQQSALCSGVKIPYTARVSGYAPTCSDNSQCAGTISFDVNEVAEKSGEALLEKQVRVQPVLVTVSASSDTWFLYTGGILTSCPQTRWALPYPMIVIGFGTENGVGFWKVRNAWGTIWGEQGDMRLLRGIGGRGTCNIAAHFMYPVIPSRNA